MIRYLKSAALLLVLALSLSCQAVTSTGTPRTATPAEIPPSSTAPVMEATAIPATFTPVPTTGIPTATEPPLSATPTPEPLPSSLNPNGPYVLFSSRSGIWIANPDGSFLTQISQVDATEQDLHAAISPNGDRLALITSSDTGLDLILVSIPDGQAQPVAHLLDITEKDLIGDPTGPKALASYAIRQYNSLAWQPGNGRLLAFIAAIDGPTADLYTYDTQTGQVTQLTSGASQAILPNWSPDGQYILHAGVNWAPPFGGAIVGYNRFDGVWAVQISDGKVITQPKPAGGVVHFVGWQDDTHYLTYDSDEACYSQNLRTVDVVSGKTAPVMNLSFYYSIAQSPQNKALIFAGTAGCANSPGDGVFLLQPGQSKPVKLLDKKAYEVYWLPESGVFQAYPEALFSPDGIMKYDPPVYDQSYKPAISINTFQAWEVIENQKGRVVVNLPGADWRTIANGLVDQLLWDPATGDTLFIGLQDGTLEVGTYPDFTIRQIGNLGGSIRQAIWVP